MTKKMKQEDYKVGDVVKILNTGSTYSTYPSWADEAGATNYQVSKSPSREQRYTIRYIAPHGDYEDRHRLLGLLEDDEGRQYIFGLYGDLELAEDEADKIFKKLKTEVENEL